MGIPLVIAAGRIVGLRQRCANVSLANRFAGVTKPSAPVICPAESRCGATPMTRDERGVWIATVPLAPGRHAYVFVVDDTVWVTDPRAERVLELLQDMFCPELAETAT